MKITEREIKQLAYEEYKKIILEAASKEDTSADDMKYDKIQKLYDLGQKIKQQADNSFSHLEAFLSLGLKVRDTFEFKRAATEINRIQKLIADYSTVITRAHEIAEESTTQPQENESDMFKKGQSAIKNIQKHAKEHPKEFEPKKEPEEDDAEVLNKRPDMKHAYEAHPMSTVRPVPSKKTLKDLGAVKVKPKTVKSLKKEETETKFKNKDVERDVANWHLDYSHPGSYKTCSDCSKLANGIAGITKNKEELKEFIDSVKDAEGKPVRVRDRVIQKAFDPKTKTYKWSMIDKYRVEKIVSPNQVIVHDFNSAKDFPLNPSTLRRIGIEHLYEQLSDEEIKIYWNNSAEPFEKEKVLGKSAKFYTWDELNSEQKIRATKYVKLHVTRMNKSLKEYGAVIVNKYDEKNVITEDVKAPSLKEAMILLGLKYPADAFKITNLIENEEGDDVCTNCGHIESQHDVNGVCGIPRCHCTKFED
jgi:hypothetical protein